MFMKSNVDTPSNCILSNFISEKRYEIVFETFLFEIIQLALVQLLPTNCAGLHLASLVFLFLHQLLDPPVQRLYSRGLHLSQAQA